MPANWARTQHNLGNAILLLGLQGADPQTAKRGIAAIDQAFPIYRTIVPDETVADVLAKRDEGIAFLECVRD